MNLHLEAFDSAGREEQARRVNEIYDRIVAAGLPVLLLGDLNSVAPPSLPALPEGLTQSFANDETMEILFDGTTLRPAFPDSSYEGPNPPATFPADAPSHKIDHIYYPPDLMQPIERRIRCGAPSPPSDHCAVTASFRLTEEAEWPSADSVPSLADLFP